ncbi:hypothetical protein DIPPA_08214 [Diplonema papillatum]|nr:hypothetical protein DIPPA_08214 [Diplonema papillatum]
MASVSVLALLAGIVQSANPSCSPKGLRTAAGAVLHNDIKHLAAGAFVKTAEYASFNSLFDIPGPIFQCATVVP